MKSKLLLFAVLFIFFGLIVTGQENEKPDKTKRSKIVTVSTGLSLPMGDFSETDTEIGPAGNAKAGFFIAGSADLQWKYFGWRFEAGADFNPIDVSMLNIAQAHPNAEIKHWTKTKLMSGPFISVRLKKSDLQFGAMAGANWLYYPAITFNDGHKIQSIPTTNFAGQFFMEWSYPLSDKVSVGINAKYEFSNAKAKYLEIQKFYQLGNAFNLEYEASRPFRIQDRMTNNPNIDPGPIYTGWFGTSRSEGSVKQKISTIQIGVHIKFKLQANLLTTR